MIIIIIAIIIISAIIITIIIIIAITIINITNRSDQNLPCRDQLQAVDQLFTRRHWAIC